MDNVLAFLVILAIAGTIVFLVTRPKKPGPPAPPNIYGAGDGKSIGQDPNPKP
jgi:hypothetical protein